MCKTSVAEVIVPACVNSLKSFALRSNCFFSFSLKGKNIIINSNYRKEEQSRQGSFIFLLPALLFYLRCVAWVLLIPQAFNRAIRSGNCVVSSKFISGSIGNFSHSENIAQHAVDPTHLFQHVFKVHCAYPRGPPCCISVFTS